MHRTRGVPYQCPRRMNGAVAEPFARLHAVPMVSDGVEAIRDKEREPVLDISDHVKRLFDEFVCNLGSSFEFLVECISVEAEYVERIVGCDSHE